MTDPVNAVTIIAARFDHLLKKGADSSAMPAGATLATAGTEVDWDTPDGFPRRARKTRIWMAIWPSMAAAEAHLAQRNIHHPLLTEAVESVALLAMPYACHGQLNWSPDGEAASLYPHLARRPKDLGPVMVMTSLGLGQNTEGLVAFGQGVARVRKAFAENPAVLADINMLADLPIIDGPTVTVWRSEKDMMAAAYRSAPHRDVMGMRNAAMARASFTRMALIRAEGSWLGRSLTASAAPEGGAAQGSAE